MQRLEFLLIPEVCKRVLDGLVGHGKHPQPLDWLVGFGQFVNVGEDKLTLSTGIACVDDQFDVLALELLF